MPRKNPKRPSRSPLPDSQTCAKAAPLFLTVPTPMAEPSGRWDGSCQPQDCPASSVIVLSLADDETE